MTPIPFGGSTETATVAARHAISRGQWAEAGQWLRVITSQPTPPPQAWADLAFCLRKQQKLPEAEQTLLAAIELHPTDATFRQVLGTVYLDGQRGPDAIRAFARAIELQPESAASHYGLGVALQRDGRLRDAVRPAQTAADFEPTNLQFQLTAAVLLQWDAQADALARARRCTDRAQSIGPQTASHWQLLAKALWRLNDRDRALAANRRAVQVSPQSASAHWHLATALLGSGFWEEGWDQFEWRVAALPHLRRDFVRPQWDGLPIPGKTILLHAEGGLGDAIQFVRFLPWVAAQAGAVLLECQPALVSLLARSFPAARVYARGQSLPSFDVHLPLQGLPRLFRWTRSSAAEVPYRVASTDADAVAGWTARLAPLPIGPKVGIVWAGSPRVSEEADDRSRSLQLFRPLADVAGVTLFSLQKGDEAHQAVNAGFPIVDWTNDIESFDDLAAFVSTLDLCVCVDTGVAHLAGALGKPVWTLIPATPDFRWRLDHTDTPWYPTMRLYRQSIGQPWAEVFARVVDDLRSVRFGPVPI